MRQLQFFSTAELAVMRDRTASRRYSAEREQFRREHARHREWGLAQRHAAKLRRLHGAQGAGRPSGARSPAGPSGARSPAGPTADRGAAPSQRRPAMVSRTIAASESVRADVRPEQRKDASVAARAATAGGVTAVASVVRSEAGPVESGVGPGVGAVARVVGPDVERSSRVVRSEAGPVESVAGTDAGAEASGAGSEAGAVVSGVGPGVDVAVSVVVQKSARSNRRRRRWRKKPIPAKSNRRITESE
ncbi:hypothetical protein [Actinoplanes sp. NPDC049316]|uniref:hypothetical protein n=1 Tax=Actinoplanes sp. NPDC049316 TaxID=3154727 RepID=UPI003437C27D